MAISKVGTVTIYVDDQEASRRFYVDQLGFTVLRDADMGPMGRWLEVAPAEGQTAFVLASAAAFGKQERVGDSADVTLSCSDVRELHADLVAKGVTVTDPETQEWGSFVKLTDPDGQVFVVSEK